MRERTHARTLFVQLYFAIKGPGNKMVHIYAPLHTILDLKPQVLCFYCHRRISFIDIAE